MGIFGDATESAAIGKLLEAAIAGLVLLSAVLLISETPAYPLAYGIVLMALLYIVLHDKSHLFQGASNALKGLTSGAKQ